MFKRNNILFMLNEARTYEYIKLISIRLLKKLNNIKLYIQLNIDHKIFTVSPTSKT
jgi:hypothetical protein